MKYEERDQVDVAIDRLVDGELSADERRRLLLSLDDQPEGWRRCALAFLEAQAWKDELGELTADDGADVARRTADDVTTIPARLSGGVGQPLLASYAASARPAATSGTRMRYFLAIAASLLIAFTLGIAVREMAAPRSADTQPSLDRLVARAPERGGAPFAVPPNGVPEADVSPRAAGEAHPSDDVLTLWAADNEGLARSLRVPLVDARTIDRQLGLEFRSGLPEAVRSRLQRDGYEVYSTRRYAPLWLENGRSLVVPVEDTRIVPVSDHL